jgi:DNA polymerase I
MRQVVARLLALPKDTIHACDTEVHNIDVKKSPLGQGRVTCVSMYSGPEVDYGCGPGHALWVDTTDLEVLEAMRPFLESERCLKVWHNYGFDRHVLWNHGVDVRGFGGDTMHMARLWDASRLAGYSLEVLTDELVGRRKAPMKELFGIPALKKDGQPGRKLDMPSIEELQNNPLTRPDWIQYACYDSQGTWLLHEELRRRLTSMDWADGEVFGEPNLYHYYTRYWRPFGELLTSMEREGIKVDSTNQLPAAERRAIAQRAKLELNFRRWAASYCPAAWFMNPSSGTQVAQLLFGGAANPVSREHTPLRRSFNLLRCEYEELLAARDGATLAEEASYGFHLEPGSSTREVETERLPHRRAAGPTAAVVPLDPLEAFEAVKPGVKNVEFELISLGLTVPGTTKKGQPRTDAATLQLLAGAPFDSPPVYGTAYEQFGGGAKGAEACEAIASLVGMGAIDTMLSNFILPLQENADERSRVHCSLNLNTETGRLSSRAPNLQNQPALEKDQYRIREAFCADEGNALVVADYGQLELRLLAHMTDCQSMIAAFKSGGCFHSRTAMGMFAHVRTAVDKGDCLLEWDWKQGKPPAPLLKDVFGSERRRAKTLNFSIAYGKTVHGLSKDWGVTVGEARAMLDAWYADRPEVREWQQQTIRRAHETGWTRTLMGRYRKLEGIQTGTRAVVAHHERAAINTPIQGGAADIMTLAMLKIKSSQILAELGYRLLLQIHDEVILEGPQEHALAAKEEVVRCMQHPFDDALPSLKVDLVVDAKTAKNWYEAK